MSFVRTTVTATTLLFIAIPVAAQPQSDDERAIRDLIARYDKGESIARTEDSILWSGEMKRPTVGSEQRDPLPLELRPSSARASNAPSERVPGGRTRVTTPIRIEIAESGDLAYEFSNSELRFELKNGDRETALPASVLRVWKKDAGAWKIAAMFARPRYVEATTPAK